jgi:hypothetical protein
VALFNINMPPGTPNPTGYTGAGAPPPTMTPVNQRPENTYMRPPGYQDISVNTGRFMNPNQSLIQQYGNLGPQYQSALQGISGLARLLQGGGAGLYNVGSQSYGNALDYYNQILGGSKAAGMRAIAPQVSNIEDVSAGAQASLEASGLRGGALQQATADLLRQKAGQIGNLIPQAQQVAAQQAGTLGLGGAQAGIGALQGAGGMNQTVAAMEAQRLQTAAQQEQANRFGGAAVALQGAGLQLQDLLGMRSLDVNERLGLGQLGVEQGNQALQYWMGPQQIGLGQQSLDIQKQQIENQRKAQEGAKWGNVFGSVLGAIPGIGPLLKGGGGGSTPAGYSSDALTNQFGYGNSWQGFTPGAPGALGTYT